MSEPRHAPNLLDLREAAAYLDVPADAISALVAAGYLAPADKTDGPRFPVVDLKAFIARNAENGSGNLFEAEPANVDPQGLLDALDGKSDEMARRAFDIFSTAFPEAAAWSLTEQARFVEQAKARFEAILAVTSQGATVDEALVGDLQEVGAAAAASGSPLPQLLVILRISRDLVVQTAIELAEERGRHWGLALSLLLTRVLPAMDRLTDALAQGYWAATVRREEESRARYEHVVEESSDGVYEIDLDGRVLYANASLAIIVGRSLEQLSSALLTAMLVPADAGDVDRLLSEPPAEGQRFEMESVRADGVRRVLDVRTLPRRVDGEIVGLQGVVRDVSAGRVLEEERKQFLSLVTSELRHPLNTVLGLGATLETHAAELPPDRVVAMARSIRNQAERISRLADDLHDVAQLEAQSLLLSPRPVDLAQVVGAALASVGGADWVQQRVPPGTTVHADPRRLEQVVSNLVEFVVVNGEPPVAVELGAALDDESVHLVVTDDGPGLDEPTLVPLFSSLRAGQGPSGGLGLVRGLIEAMGGRVWYDRAPDFGSRFHLTVPLPRRRASAT